jgi:hypothetical protein
MSYELDLRKGISLSVKCSVRRVPKYQVAGMSSFPCARLYHRAKSLRLYSWDHSNEWSAIRK